MEAPSTPEKGKQPQPSPQRGETESPMKGVRIVSPGGHHRERTNSFHGTSGLLLVGNYLYHKGDYPKALEKYKLALEQEMELGEGDKRILWNLHNRICATYTRMKDYESALKAANEMIRLNPEDPKGHVRKGGINYFSQRYQEALQDYETAKEVALRNTPFNPDDSTAKIAKYIAATQKNLGARYCNRCQKMVSVLNQTPATCEIKKLQHYHPSKRESLDAEITEEEKKDKCMVHKWRYPCCNKIGYSWFLDEDNQGKVDEHGCKTKVVQLKEALPFSGHRFLEQVN
ncbi:Stress-induced-phosphoprotein 1 [Balamuthia mandrillaris]